MAKLKLPFELEKPSSNEYVTQASEIGYGNGSVEDELNIGIPNKYGRFVNINDFAYVITDSANKILFAIKKDGEIIFGVGIPQSIEDYISSVLEDIVAFLGNLVDGDKTLTNLLSEKVDIIEGKGLSTNDYTDADKEKVSLNELTALTSSYIRVILDSANKLLEGIKRDGTKVIPGNLEVGGTVNGVKIEEGKGFSTNDYTNADKEVVELNSVIPALEFVKIILDDNSRILFAIKRNADVIFGCGVPSQIVSYISEQVSILNNRIDNIEDAKIPYKKSNFSDMGNLDYQLISETDYSQIIMYGQSLSMGWEAPIAISENPVPNVYMVGDKVAILHGNNGSDTLNPLVSTKANSCGENPTVAAVNSFATLYHKFVDKTQGFIGTSCGEGGKSIEKLSKECTNGTNYYSVEFISALTRTKAAVDAENKTVGCSAILFMQGEYNYILLKGGGLTPGTDATNDKDTYKAYLLTLKNNMQSDIMSQYGQTKKPLFFIYEVCGGFINNTQMSINMAQVEFAMENDDVFLLNPTYFTPDYSGGHLSTNGYRWYGEIIAKSLFQVLIKGIKYTPVIYPINFVVQNKKIYIDFQVPVLPLVFDTWTKESIAKYGFRVFKNSTEITIQSLAIEENRVVLSFDSDLSGEIEITYAGQGRSGSGNLRDSDEFHSLYVYYDDSISQQTKPENYTPEDKGGNKIYGKPYPLYNWCSNFYKKITI